MKKYVKLIDRINFDEYRSIPFWSWNGKLENDMLIKQIHWMKRQGFGGYFMHARGGLITPYLGDEWFDAIKTCIKEGEKLGMKSWAYDENGWPSGFVGGKLLEDFENRDCYLTYEYGNFDHNALVSYQIIDGQLKRLFTDSSGECLNVYLHHSLSTVDILNYDVVQKFINETHEKYKQVLGKDFSGLAGFFTDEPQYFRSKHPYTKVLEKYFLETYNVDILDYLGLMFVEAEGYRDFRYKYWKAMQTLMLNNFAKHVYDWCKDNNVGFTGHYIEETLLELQMTCCGGIMPFYEYEDIPGIDKLKRSVDNPVAAKQVSSVARQLGKKQVISETFAMCGWDVTPKELKVIAEAQYVNGVNLMCQHLLPYAEHGQRKRDYPSHYSWVNPWVEHDFKTFNDYFARLGALLGETKEIVNVGIFCPLRSIYFDYKRDKPFKHMYQSLDRYYVELIEKLAKYNIGFHILDETIMARHGRVVDNTLQIGECSYEYIVFPKILTMDETSKDLLEEYYQNGGKLLFTKELPIYLEGNLYSYHFDSNVTFEEIIHSQAYQIEQTDTMVQSTLHELDGNLFLYVVNTDLNHDVDVTYHGNFKSFVSVDLETLTEEKLDVNLHLEAGDSKILFFSDEPIERKLNLEEFSLEGPFEIVKADENSLTLDKAYYSFDGINYTDKYHVMGIFDELMSKRINQDIFVKYIFEIEEIPSDIKLYLEDMNIIDVLINGHEASFTEEVALEKGIKGIKISPFVKKGLNEIVVKLHFYEKPEIYYALYTDGVTESLRNCISYDTTIEACYLKGDFGVYSHSGFRKGKEKNVLISDDDFYISKKKTMINDLVSEGYPFFSGGITIKKKVNLLKKDVVLNLLGRHQLSYLKVNGITVPKSYFKEKINISKYVHIGENELEITLISSNRNLLGPHHFKTEEEPFAVRPTTFEALKSWEKGKSSLYRDDYSFVKFGLFLE